MPKVNPGEARPLVQALVARLYSKNVRLVLEDVLLYRRDWPNDEVEEAERVVPKRVKGSNGHVTPEELALIDAHQAQLTTMLRYDWDYGRELIYGVHNQLLEAYPRGVGCDVSEATEMIQRGLDRLEEKDMHGLWYWLDRALEKGLAICEDAKLEREGGRSR